MEYCSRNVWHYSNDPAGPITCEDYMNEATNSDTDLVTSICATYNFADLDSIRYFVHGMWQPDH
jgi:hypothetical protein